MTLLPFSKSYAKIVTVKFEQTMVDSVYLLGYDEEWSIVSKGKVINNLVKFKCPDSILFFEIRYRNIIIGLYLKDKENYVKIVNDKIEIGDSINYIINSKLEYLVDQEIIRKSIFKCKDSILYTYLLLSLASKNDLIENVYPCTYIKYFGSIPGINDFLENFLRRYSQSKDLTMIKLFSDCIYNKKSLKSFYKFLINGLYSENSYLIVNIMHLILNETKDVGFSPNDLNYMKSIIEANKNMILKNN